jgi:protein-S-isoprenylcysteine O-methyltransferase Ste14
VSARVHVESAVTAALAAAWLGLPCAAAGTLRWPAFWIYAAVLVASVLGHGAWVARRAPGLRERRRHVGAGTPAWDLAWVSVFWPSMVAAPVAAGLEVRAGGPALGPAAAVAGAVLLGAAFALSARAMEVNPFFEGTARLQPHQVVVDRGPYARVRHPGYVALAVWALATPLLLRSRWAFAPAALTACWVALRTALEDRMLRRGLAGYAEYAGRVRARLVPGLW